MWKPAPPELFNFSWVDKWIRRFKRFQLASGLDRKSEGTQVNTLILYQSFGMSIDDKKVHKFNSHKSRPSLRSGGNLKTTAYPTKSVKRQKSVPWQMLMIELYFAIGRQHSMWSEAYIVRNFRCMVQTFPDLLVKFSRSPLLPFQQREHECELRKDSIGSSVTHALRARPHAVRSKESDTPRNPVHFFVYNNSAQ